MTHPDTLPEQITIAPGVTELTYSWGRSLKGCKDDLLRAGLVRDEWLPTGDRDARGRRVLTRNLEHEGRLIQCRLIHRRQLYQVDLEFTSDELERAAERQARTAERQTFERALAEERLGLEAIPKSHERYRQICASTIPAQLAHAIESLCESGNKYSGFAYAPEVIEELHVKVQEVRGILETGRTLFSQEGQSARVAEIKALTAQADPALRSLLEKLKAA